MKMYSKLSIVPWCLKKLTIFTRRSFYIVVITLKCKISDFIIKIIEEIRRYFNSSGKMFYLQNWCLVGHFNYCSSVQMYIYMDIMLVIISILFKFVYFKIFSTRLKFVKQYFIILFEEFAHLKYMYYIIYVI